MHNETFLAWTPTAALPSGEFALRLRLTNLVRGRRILDLACGNGRWTGVASRAAELIVATDPSPEQLSIARRRIYDCRVSFTSEIERAREMVPMPDCLMASMLLGRLGMADACARIEQCLDQVDGEAVVLLLEGGAVSDEALDGMLPGAVDLRVQRTEFVSLISCRIGRRSAGRVSGLAMQATGHH